LVDSCLRRERGGDLLGCRVPSLEVCSVEEHSGQDTLASRARDESERVIGSKSVPVANQRGEKGETRDE
jgi:hypothetical protein